MAIDFGGTDEFLLINDDPSLSFGDSFTDDPMTIVAWINMDDATTFRIINKNNVGGNEFEWLFSMTGGDDLQVNLLDNDGNNFIAQRSDDPFTADEGSWITVSATYDGNGLAGGLKLQRNGVLRASSDVSGGAYTAMHNFNTNVVIGRSSVDGASYANGKIGEVSIWRAELTAAELLQLYNSKIKHMALQTSPPDLELALSMNDGANGTSADGDTIRDMSVNGNDATGDDGVGASLIWAAEDVMSYPASATPVITPAIVLGNPWYYYAQHNRS